MGDNALGSQRIVRVIGFGDLLTNVENAVRSMRQADDISSAAAPTCVGVNWPVRPEKSSSDRGMR